MTKEDMNNFYCNLPSGHYREHNDPKRSELFKTIDNLLETEFPDMNAGELAATMYEANGLYADALNGLERTFKVLQGLYNRKTAWEKASAVVEKTMEKSRRITEKAEAQILPLYQRLVELGFSEEFLKQ